MKILFVAAEALPFAKVGGLADVASSLPAALQQLGHEVRLVLPHYGVIDDATCGVEPLIRFELNNVEVIASQAESHGVPVCLVRGGSFFSPDENSVYLDGDAANNRRYLFYCRAVLAMLPYLGWDPDVIHLHDWHTGVLPYLLAESSLASIPTLLTLHNLAYQGSGMNSALDEIGLPRPRHPLLKKLDSAGNALAIGVAYTTLLNTVSPRYAQEILQPENAYGLHPLLRARADSLVGILNGLDTDLWDPCNEHALIAPYDVNSLERKVLNKRALQEKVGLPIRDDVPLLTTVTRLVDQKGISILLAALFRLLIEHPIQFILLGTGSPEYEDAFGELADSFPDRVVPLLKFDAMLSQQIYAGADVFVMPSKYEPCGLGQMIAMRYGTVPIVRSVGGLADTVDETVGFAFESYEPAVLYDMLVYATRIYTHDPARWRGLQLAGMQKDFSWAHSAERYVELYQRAVTAT